MHARGTRDACNRHVTGTRDARDARWLTARPGAVRHLLVLSFLAFPFRAVDASLRAGTFSFKTSTVSFEAGAFSSRAGSVTFRAGAFSSRVGSIFFRAGAFSSRVGAPLVKQGGVQSGESLTGDGRHCALRAEEPSVSLRAGFASRPRSPAWHDMPPCALGSGWSGTHAPADDSWGSGKGLGGPR